MRLVVVCCFELIDVMLWMLNKILLDWFMCVLDRSMMQMMMIIGKISMRERGWSQPSDVNEYFHEIWFLSKNLFSKANSSIIFQSRASFSWRKKYFAFSTSLKFRMQSEPNNHSFAGMSEVSLQVSQVENLCKWMLFQMEEKRKNIVMQITKKNIRKICIFSSASFNARTLAKWHSSKQVFLAHNFSHAFDTLSCRKVFRNCLTLSMRWCLSWRRKTVQVNVFFQIKGWRLEVSCCLLSEMH